LKPVVLGNWDIAGRTGLTPSAEAAQRRLLQFISRLGRAAAKYRTAEKATPAEKAALVETAH
jgi:hypothetical protein